MTSQIADDCSTSVKPAVASSQVSSAARHRSTRPGRRAGAQLRQCFIILALTALTLRPGLAHSQTYPMPVPYRGGGFMNGPAIYPLFIGNYWSTQAGLLDRFSVVLYLANFVNFMNGANAPANQKPYLTQYGVGSASLQNIVTVGWSNGQLSDTSIQNEIWALQQSGQLPPTGRNVLIMVFPGTGLTPAAGTSLGYHRAFQVLFSAPYFYGVVFKGGNVSQSVGSSHEIQEAATDPGWSYGGIGWAVDAAHEICDDATCGDPAGQYKSFTSNGITIIGCADNTQGGRCTTTGYIPQ